MAQIERKREAESNKSGRLQKMHIQQKELSHELVKAKTAVEFKESALAEEQKKLGEAESAVTDAAKASDAKRAEHQGIAASFATSNKQHETTLEELGKDEELLQTLTTGMASKASADGVGGGYMGRLADARSRLAAAGNEIKQNKMKSDHLQKEVKTKEASLKKAQKESTGLDAELEAAKASAEQMKEKLKLSGFDAERGQELRALRAKLLQRVSQLSDRRDALAAKLTALDFNYADPEPNFDRSRVKGLVANLVELDADKVKYSTALEVCAGGRLYNVVVEDERTGSQLLTKGQLKKRVTLIPLNKINAFVASAAKVGAAQKIAPGKVDLALSLIGYEDEVAKAMQYVFGNTLVCADAATAKRVTFDNAVKLKSVTLEGDVYDPAGTLSGGSKPSTGGMLVKAQELNRVQKELEGAKRELKKLDVELQQEENKAQKMAGLTKEMQLKQHQVALLEDRIASSAATRLAAEVKAALETIAQLAEASKDAEERQAKSKEEIEFFEKEMKEFGADKEAKLLELRASIKKRKATIQKTSTSIKNQQTQVRTLALELEQAEAEIVAAKEAVQTQQKQVEKAQRDLDAQQKSVADMQVRLESEKLFSTKQH